MVRYGKRPKAGTIFQQHDERDCGPVCLKSICAHYGARYSTAYLRDLTKTDSRGTNVYGLVDAAQQIGFDAVAIAGTFEELVDSLRKGEICLPAIAHTIVKEGFEHYVVIYALNPGDKLMICDPARGFVQMPIETFLTEWTGVLVSLRCEEGGLRSGDSKSIAALLRGLLVGKGHLAFFAIASSLVITAIGICGAFVFQYAIDAAIMKFSVQTVEGLLGQLFFVCLGICLLYSLQVALGFIRGRCMAKFACELDREIMLDYFNHVINLPLFFFGTKKTGEILSRFSDARGLRETISSVVFTALIDCAMVLVGVAVLVSISVQLALVSIVLFASYIGIAGWYRGKLEKNNRELKEKDAQLNSFIKEAVDGIRSIKAASQEGNTYKRAESDFSKLLSLGFDQSLMANNQIVLVGFCSSLASTAVLWIGANSIAIGTLSMGELISFNALLGYFLAPLQRIVGLQPQIQSGLIAMERLEDITHFPIEERSSGLRVENLQSIELKNASFRYGHRELVLRDVSLVVRRGETVAIFGESGSGKSTLVELLLGFAFPTEGKILVNGQNMSSVNLSSLRKRISYVPQSDYLFSGTIRENILFGNDDATDGDIERVCRFCNLAGLIKSMPLGLDSPVEERGLNYSGGERQRIILARALLRTADMLVLDEATSSLDSVNEKEIIAKLLALEATPTKLIVSHRISSVAQCDRIIHISKGKVIGVGSHASLLAEKGAYFQCWQYQMGNAKNLSINDN